MPGMTRSSRVIHAGLPFAFHEKENQSQRAFDRVDFVADGRDHDTFSLETRRVVGVSGFGHPGSIAASRLAARPHDSPTVAGPQASAHKRSVWGGAPCCQIQNARSLLAMSRPLVQWWPGGRAAVGGLGEIMESRIRDCFIESSRRRRWVGLSNRRRTGA